jgi:GTP diphosphokinase / guanosine-3',5'-bis(diphosphate) 3'-diphosphatase
VAGDVVLTGTSTADAARTDAQQPEDRVADVVHAEAAGAASVPGRRAPAEAQPSAAQGTGSGVGVKRRLARLGAQRGATMNPVLEPLIKTVRGTHPKADVRLIERSYETAAYWHRDQKRRSGDPYITHPLAVATILAELGMNT